MKILFIFSSIFFCNHISSQEKIDLFSKFITESIGINQITKDSIFAKEVYFEYFINDHGYDSINNIIHAKLYILTDDGVSSKEGIIAAVDLDSNRLIWSNKYNLNKTSYNFLENNIYLKQKDKYYKINSITQENQIPLKSFIYTDTSFDKDFGICFSKDENISNVMKLTAINIKTNQTIWESELQYQKEFFIADPVRYGEQFYFINTQLNSINLKTGKTNTIGKDFEVNTRKSNSDALLAGYLLGGVIGYAVVSSFTTEVIYTEKTFSNLLFLDSFYFFANRENIYKLNYKNELLNEIKTPNKVELINSEFKFKNGFIYLINKGRPNSFEYNSFVKYNLNLEIIRSEYLGDELIIDVNFNDSFAYLIQYNSCKKLNLYSNQMETVNYIDKNYISAKSLYDSIIYFEENKTFIPINLFDTNKFYLKAAKEDSISAFDLNMKLQKKYSIFRFSKLIYKNDKLKFIQNKGECFILNNENKLILELPNIEKLIYRNKKYYISLDNQIMIIDENQLVK